MTKNFFFYGVYEGNEDNEEIWEVLHQHFKKLAGKDDEGVTKSGVSFSGKATKRK
jgi:hypothetical protein